MSAPILQNYRDFETKPVAPLDLQHLVALDTESESRELPLSFYLGLIRRYRSQLITWVLLATTAATLLTLSLRKQYEATVLVRVDPVANHVVGQEDSRSSNQVDTNVIVTTEAQVVTSSAVEWRAIQDLGLASNPEFADVMHSTAGQNEDMRDDALLRAVGKDISVAQPLATVLLSIGFRSHDPQLSATAANTLAQAFLDQEYATRARALTDSTRSMSSQLDGLRAQMERDQAALVNYESTHDVIDPDNKENIYQARLSQINADLSAAQSERMKLQSEYEVVSGGNLDALLATPSGQPLLVLDQKLIGDQRDLSRMESLEGQNHPLFEEQLAVVQHDRDVLTEQERHTAAQIRSQYMAAAERDQLIQGALNTEKAAIDDFNMRTIQYHSLKAAADSSTKLYYDLQQQIQDATVAAGLRAEDLRIISPARPPDRPVFPRPLLVGLVALLLSATLGVGAVVITGLMDRTVSTVDQAELQLRTPVMGSLPLITGGRDPLALEISAYGTSPTLDGDRVKAASPNTKQRSGFQEALLSLHSALEFRLAGAGGALAVTSSLPAEGKSTIAAHLAAAAARFGIPTILIDADMRRPRSHHLFGVSNQKGLSSVLRGQMALTEAIIPLSPTLSLLPAGPATNVPTELVRMGLATVLEELKQSYANVIIDCPPILGISESYAISNLADNMVLVVMANKTDQRLINASLRAIKVSRGNLLGIVLNCVNTQHGGYYSYYKSYYTEKSHED